MARIVKRIPTSPLKVETTGKPLWICQCGLSKGQPHCDGSHKQAATEEAGKLYLYDPSGPRKEIDDTFGSIPTA